MLNIMTHNIHIPINEISVYSVLFLFLCSCATAYTPPRDTKRKTITEPRLLDASVVLSDGTTLYAVNGIRDSDAPIVIGIHGLGGHANEFHYFMEYADQHDISYLSFDLRGFGHWKEHRGDMESLKIWLPDIRDIVSAIRDMYPERKIILMGQSLGASVAFWYSSEYKNVPEALPDGIISLSIVTRPNSRINVRNFLQGTIGYLFYPRKSMYIGAAAGNAGHNQSLSGDTKLNSLRLNRVSFRVLLQAKYVIEKTPEYISQLSIPILAFQGAEDDYSRSDEVSTIVEKMKHREFMMIKKCGHSLLNAECGAIINESIGEWTKKIHNGTI